MKIIKPQVETNFNLWFVERNASMRDYQPMVSTLGTYIKTKLAEKSQTQSWLAEKLGVSNNAVSKWIKTGKISRKNFFPLVSALGKKGAPFVDDCADDGVSQLRLVSQQSPTSDLEKEVLQGFRDASDEIKGSILYMARTATEKKLAFSERNENKN